MAKSSPWSNFKLRLALFRIWFMKNILVWLQIFGIICIVCMLTGNLTESTPILGKIIYPIFKPLVDEIVYIINEKEISGVMDFFGITISLLTSVGLFVMKVKNIAQEDIKSKKLKIALINANLYFNEDGKLVKKVEKMTKTDIDGDGKADNEGTVNTGLIGGLVSAVKEFTVIASADLSSPDEDENQKAYDKAVEDAGLVGVDEAYQDLKQTVKTGTTNKVIDEMVEESNKRIDETKDSDMTNVEKVKRIGLFAKLKERLMKKKKPINKEEDAEIIENNIEKDAEEKTTIKKELTPQDIISQKAQKQEQQAANEQNAVSDFLKKMRGY